MVDLIISENGKTELLRDVKAGETLTYQNRYMKERNEIGEVTALKDIYRGNNYVSGEERQGGEIVILTNQGTDPYLVVNRQEKKIVAWTYVYRPFTLGGRVNKPIGFEFNPKNEIDLGKGYFGYELKSPNGTTIIVEKTSGAIVGSSIQQVMQDIAEAEESVMKQQISEAIKNSQGMTIVSETEFWRIYEK